MRLVQLAFDAGSMDEEAFSNAYPRPCLVFVGLPGAVTGISEETPHAKTHQAKTDGADVRIVAERNLVPSAADDDFVFFLGKSRRNSFGGLIVVGRQPKSDLILNSPLVSKVHLFFMPQVGGSGWTVVDPGSTNGTRLNGHPLRARSVESIWDGDELVLACEIRATFHTPGGLFRRLARMAEEARRGSATACPVEEG
ncbi:MAG TPA: FHA domain-containing protein [Planctomycetota bacterium]|nr:FHA domain-containing protein [Planctomycetota bacterium]